MMLLRKADTAPSAFPLPLDQVCSVKGMALRAMRAIPAGAGRSDLMLSAGNRLKVFGVDAMADGANVVEFLPLGDRPNMEFVGNTVGQGGFRGSDADSAISTTHSTAVEQPTARRADYDPLHQSLMQGSSRVLYATSRHLSFKYVRASNMGRNLQVRNKLFSWIETV